MKTPEIFRFCNHVRYQKRPPCKKSKFRTGSSLFDVVVFLLVPTDIRIFRLKQRETQRYGEKAISVGGQLYETHKDFIEWATSYDYGDENMRSRQSHEKWLVRRLADGLFPVRSSPLPAPTGCATEY